MNLIAGGNGKAWFSSDSLRLGIFLIELYRFCTVKDVSFDKGGKSIQKTPVHKQQRRENPNSSKS